MPKTSLEIMVTAVVAPASFPEERQMIHYTALKKAFKKEKLPWGAYPTVVINAGNVLLSPRIFAYMASFLESNGTASLTMSMSGPLRQTLYDNNRACAQRFFREVDFRPATGTFTFRQPRYREAALYLARIDMDKKEERSLASLLADGERRRVQKAVQKRFHLAEQINAILGDRVVTAISVESREVAGASIFALRLNFLKNLKAAEHLLQQLPELTNIGASETTLWIFNQDVSTFLQRTDIPLPITSFSKEERALFLQNEEPKPRTLHPLTERLIVRRPCLRKEMNTLWGHGVVLEIDATIKEGEPPDVLLTVADTIKLARLKEWLEQRLLVEVKAAKIRGLLTAKYVLIPGEALGTFLDLTDPKKQETWVGRSHSPQRQAVVSTPGNL